MTRLHALAFLVFIGGWSASPEPAPEGPSAQQVADARVAFETVATVLTHPRCSNCHPRDGVPTQTDAQRPHAMNISRLSAESGLPCNTCHQTKNAEAIGVPGGPPGAPHWGLPPAAFPSPFRGHTPASLCAQLKDPAQNGERSLAELQHHISEDPLVLWGWDPGGDRTRPPVSHARFVEAFDTWVRGGGACPEEPGLP